ncbi:C4-dicarboxylate ABC transporter permease [Sinanaerobacter sp. ZZT-01]|uniref:YfcC family protein n=1 Tax=Sinanaerobacter sp. ZZT-01 TaxID=3111540 RepID=UPI002D79D036|nr:C4-dicarboxylate ABC transporter permease [Sinanaerobacter sp. ZZT-01]WRR94962.1 C4-dicarboxylate ABC transporter permease [Sinanaerobacter sp. ZZT-01]
MKRRHLDTYVVLTLIIFFMALASFLIPSGSYQRSVDVTNGIEYVIPDSFTFTEKTNLSLLDFMRVIPDGMMQASEIIIFVLIAGGSLGIINATGTINGFISTVSSKFKTHGSLAILLLMLCFSLSGALLGTAEEALPLYPIVMVLALSLGYDKITGVSIVLLGTGVGFVAGFLNPFTVGIAQQVSGLPLFSGMVYRLLVYLVFFTITILYVLNYAKKNRFKTSLNEEVMADSYLAEYDFSTVFQLTKRQIGVVFVLCFFTILLMCGVLWWRFYILEIAACFFFMGIFSGIIGGLDSGKIVSEFMKGAASLLYGALIIGMAKSIFVVMQSAGILDTVIYYLVQFIEKFSRSVNVISMFLVQSIINLFITSGSGQAAVTMPIMKNIADLTSIPRQSAILAFQFGDGFSNVISPTSGYFMAALGIAGVNWREWAKFMFPLFAIWCMIGCVMLVISIYVY